jgi:threonylcarbamoyladenosine tRNA methylthiotransferase MtaB
LSVLFRTFGCKANQYDTERMRQELEALGARTTSHPSEARLCVVNTCTVTNQADADARRFIRRLRREHPGVEVVVAGCSSALRPNLYRTMDGVVGVVEGHDPVELARAVEDGCGDVFPETSGRPGPGKSGSLLTRREGGARGWLKIQDGCDRKCSFCATRLARGPSRSRPPHEVVAEARLLSLSHPELVLTGIHIGHYGKDLDRPITLARLVALLLEQVPDVRFRLGSVEATEVDGLLLDLLETSGGRLAPHLHMPLQSGSDAVLRRMRRWHTRDAYRRRALQVAGRIPVLGLGADVITGFPGEAAEDHVQTRSLVEELPFTYLHVFPFSPRVDTPAAELGDPVPQRVAGERSRELREMALEKGRRYREGRVGGRARVVLEGDGGWALTEDYLRVQVRGGGPAGTGQGLLSGNLGGRGDHLHIDLSHSFEPISGHLQDAAQAGSSEGRPISGHFQDAAQAGSGEGGP